MQKTDMQKLKLKGNVKSLKELSYKATYVRSSEFLKGSREREPFETSQSSDFVYVYNTGGNKIEEKYFDNENEIESIKRYKYNDEGRLIEKIAFDNNERIIQTWKYTLNDNGKIIEENIYNQDNRIDYKAIYFYDKNGNRTEEEFYESNGSLDYKALFSFDTKGNIVESTIVNSNGDIDEKCFDKYDEKGQNIEKIQQDKYGTNKKNTYKFDDEGNILEQKMYNADNLLGGNRKLINIWRYKHDRFGNLTEWIEIDKEYPDWERQLTYKYVYDKNNNWITRIDFIRDSQANYILERTIDYY